VENNKSEVVKKLNKLRLDKLAGLVENDLINPNDAITTMPICFIADRELKLKDSLIENEHEHSYEAKVANQAIKIIELFEALYPGVQIGDLTFRQKSEKSIIGKIKNLEVERISKLAVAYAERPDLVEEARENKLYKILKKPDLSEKEKVFEEFKYANEYEQIVNTMKVLLAERVNECIVQPSNIPGSEEILQIEKNEILECIDNLMNRNRMLNYNRVSQTLLNEERFSSSTSTALARLLYSRIKTDTETIITDLDGNTSIKKIDDKFRQGTINVFKSKYKQMLNFESIERTLTPTPEWKEKIYEETYDSRIDRLVDESEFLRVKDLYGMHIAVQYIPDDFKSSNMSLNTNLRIRNSLRDKDKKQYREYDQKCMETLANDFWARLKGEGISNEYLERHPEIAEKWQAYIQSTRILPDSEKYKRKPNGYIADHIKFKIDGNPLHILEAQICSVYVLLRSKGKGSASHAGRFGKERIAPTVIEDESVNLEELTEEQINGLSKELEFYVPSYYKIEKNNETNRFDYKKLNLYENCERFYEDFNDPNNTNKHEQNVYNRLLFGVNNYENELDKTISIENDINNSEEHDRE